MSSSPQRAALSASLQSARRTLDIEARAVAALSVRLDDSFAQAREFFPRYFPEYPVKTANLWSWLIDPYLLDNLPQDSNMVRFGRRFTPYGEPTDSQDGAIFFTFRTHGTDHLDELPQDTTLQRLVVGRIKDGGTWQSAYGYLRL